MSDNGSMDESSAGVGANGWSSARLERAVLNVVIAVSKARRGPSRKWKLLGKLVCTCQMLAFLLDSSFPWDNRFIAPFADVIYAFQVPIWDPEFTGVTHVGAAISTLVAIFLTILYISWWAWTIRSSSKENTSLGLLRWMERATSLCSSVAFIPVLRSLAAHIACTGRASSAASDYFLVSFPDVKCFSDPMALVLFVLSVLVFAAFAGVTIVLELLVFDPSYRDELYLDCKPTGRIDAVSKVLTVVMVGAAHFLRRSPLVLAGVFLAYIISNALLYAVTLPFYSRKFNALTVGGWTIGLGVGAAGVLTVVMDAPVITSVVLYAGLPVCFAMGYIAARASYWYQTRYRDRVMSLGDDDEENAGELSPAREGALPGPSFLRKHIKNYWQWTFQVEIALRFALDAPTGENILLAERILAYYCSHFPSALAEIYYIQFLVTFKSDPIFARVRMNKARKLEPTLDERMLLLRKEMFFEEQRIADAHGGDVSALALTDLKRYLQTARRHHVDTLKSFADFWGELVKKDVILSRLPAIMTRIERSEDAADAAFKKLLSKFSNSRVVLRAYAQYVDEVKMDAALAAEYNARADLLESTVSAGVRRNSTLSRSFHGSDAGFDRASLSEAASSHSFSRGSGSLGSSVLQRVANSGRALELSNKLQASTAVRWLRYTARAMFVGLFLYLVVSFSLVYNSENTRMSQMGLVEASGNRTSLLLKVCYEMRDLVVAAETSSNVTSDAFVELARGRLSQTLRELEYEHKRVSVGLDNTAISSYDEQRALVSERSITLLQVVDVIPPDIEQRLANIIDSGLIFLQHANLVLGMSNEQLRTAEQDRSFRFVMDNGPGQLLASLQYSSDLLVEEADTTQASMDITLIALLIGFCLWLNVPGWVFFQGVFNSLREERNFALNLFLLIPTSVIRHLLKEKKYQQNTRQHVTGEELLHDESTLLEQQRPAELEVPALTSPKRQTVQFRATPDVHALSARSSSLSMARTNSGNSTGDGESHHGLAARIQRSKLSSSADVTPTTSLLCSSDAEDLSNTRLTKLSGSETGDESATPLVSNSLDVDGSLRRAAKLRGKRERKPAASASDTHPEGDEGQAASVMSQDQEEPDDKEDPIAASAPANNETPAKETPARDALALELHAVKKEASPSKKSPRKKDSTKAAKRDSKKGSNKDAKDSKEHGIGEAAAATTAAAAADEVAVKVGRCGRLKVLLRLDGRRKEPLPFRVLVILMGLTLAVQVCIVVPMIILISVQSSLSAQYTLKSTTTQQYTDLHNISETLGAYAQQFVDTGDGLLYENYQALRKDGQVDRTVSKLRRLKITARDNEALGRFLALRNKAEHYSNIALVLTLLRYGITPIRNPLLLQYPWNFDLETNRAQLQLDYPNWPYRYTNRSADAQLAPESMSNVARGCMFSDVYLDLKHAIIDLLDEAYLNISDAQTSQRDQILSQGKLLLGISIGLSPLYILGVAAIAWAVRIQSLALYGNNVSAKRNLQYAVTGAALILIAVVLFFGLSAVHSILMSTVKPAENSDNAVNGRADVNFGVQNSVRSARVFVALGDAKQVGRHLNYHLQALKYIMALQTDNDQQRQMVQDILDDYDALNHVLTIAMVLSAKAHSVDPLVMEAIDLKDWDISKEPSYTSDRVRYPERKLVYSTYQADTSLTAAQQLAIARSILYDRKIKDMQLDLQMSLKVYMTGRQDPAQASLSAAFTRLSALIYAFMSIGITVVLTSFVVFWITYTQLSNEKKKRDVSIIKQHVDVPLIGRVSRNFGIMVVVATLAMVAVFVAEDAVRSYSTSATIHVHNAHTRRDQANAVRFFAAELLTSTRGFSTWTPDLSPAAPAYRVLQYLNFHPTAVTHKWKLDDAGRLALAAKDGLLYGAANTNDDGIHLIDATQTEFLYNLQCTSSLFRSAEDGNLVDQSACPGGVYTPAHRGMGGLEVLYLRFVDEALAIGSAFSTTHQNEAAMMSRLEWLQTADEPLNALLSASSGLVEIESHRRFKLGLQLSIVTFIIGTIVITVLYLVVAQRGIKELSLEELRTKGMLDMIPKNAFNNAGHKHGEGNAEAEAESAGHEGAPHDA